MFYNKCFNDSEMKRKTESNPSATSQLSILLMNTFTVKNRLESMKYNMTSF